MTSVQVTVVLAATVSSGLLAGLFYSFSCAVLPGLARTDDDVFVATMTAINRAILNGRFALSFFGAPLLSVLSVVALGPTTPGVRWAAAAILAHGVTWAITFAVNVPLNRRLESASVRGAGPERDSGWGAGTGDWPGGARRAFEAPWRRWNAARAVSSAAAFICLVIAAL